MHKIVIAIGSDDFSVALENQLHTDFSVIRCFDGSTASELLQVLRPDILLVDLNLPVIDGSSLLLSAKQLPPFIIVTTTYDGEHLYQLASSVKLDRIFKMPTDVDNIIAAIRQYAGQNPAGAGVFDIGATMTRLGIPSERIGFRQLQKAIQLYAKEPTLAMCKELYPMVAESTSVKDGKTVEHTMRAVIKSGWLSGDRALWDHYFPGHKDTCPTNKAFIARLAQEIK